MGETRELATRLSQALLARAKVDWPGAAYPAAYGAMTSVLERVADRDALEAEVKRMEEKT